MLLEALKIALRGMRANKARTLLTALGNVIAVAALVTVVALVEGVNQDVSRAILARGADTFYVERFGPVTTDEEWERVRRRPPLKAEDAQAIRDRATLVGSVLTLRGMDAKLEAGRRSVDAVRVEGRSSEYPRFLEEELTAGRHFTESEDRLQSPVVVLGSEVAETLFEGEPPLGRSITINERPVTVIGVLASRGAFLGRTQDRYAIVPYDFSVAKWGVPVSVKISVKPSSPELLDECADEVREVVRVHRGLHPADPDPFDVLSTATYMQMYKRSTRAIYGALVGLVSLSLLVGGIIIANVMLMVVTQRTREIGIRRAVGARRGQVMAQFLVESAALSLAGGLVGLALGYVATIGAHAATSLKFPISPWSVVVGLALVVVVGGLAGLYPAARAARMDPVTALRYER